MQLTKIRLENALNVKKSAANQSEGAQKFQTSTQPSSIWMSIFFQTSLKSSLQHNYSNRQIFNCNIEKPQKSSPLPPSDTITRKALFQLNSIFSNTSSAIKSQQSPILKLPGVSTPKTVTAPPRVPQSTTQYFTISSLQHKSIADIFEPSNPKLLQKHHLFFLHHLNSSPTFSLSLAY